MSIHQSYLFYIFSLTGILIGLLFDIFRILRKSFKHSDVETILQDILFFILASILIIYTIFKFNNGDVRGYIIFGIVSGLTIYLLVFSKIFIKTNVKIIEYIKKVISFIFRIIFIPIRFVLSFFKRMILKPVSFIIINIKKSFRSIFKKMSKFMIKFNKKT